MKKTAAAKTRAIRTRRSTLTRSTLRRPILDRPMAVATNTKAVMATVCSGRATRSSDTLAIR